MESVRVAPLVGIVGCLAVLAALLAPYLLVAGGVGTYYGSGVVNPLAAGLLALVTIIVLAAGREGRADPGLAAGAGLVFGLFIFLIALGWGMTARVDVVALPEWHRWVTAGVAVVTPLSAVWYTRALGLL